MQRGASMLFLIAAAACTQSSRPDAAITAEKLETKTSTQASIEFGDRGIALGPSARIHALARAPNGRLIAAGETRAGAILACFLPDGRLAHDFGVRGVFELSRRSEHAIEDAFYGVAIDDQGRIVAVGRAGEEGRSKSLLVRVRPNGTLDTEFGDPLPKGGRLGFVIGMGDEYIDDGFANVPPEKAIPDERFIAVAVDDRGRILTAGSTGDRGETWLAKSKVCGLLPSALCHGSFRRTLIARWTPEGELDTKFHKVGYSVGDGDRKPWIKFPHDELSAIALLPAGKVVAAGFASGENNDARRSLLVRYNEKGERDETFGDNGAVLGPERARAGGKREELSALAIAPDSKLYSAGASFDERGHAHVLVLRHVETGALDPAFAEAGFTVEELGVAGELDVTLALFANGAIAGAGARLLRFSGSGALDRTFKADWTSTSSASITGLLLDQTGNRLEAGGNIGEHAFVARVASSGCLDDPRAPCER